MGRVNELILVVAAPFKKNSAPLLSMRDFEFALSFDLKWMSPDEASKVRDLAIKSRLLTLVDGMLKPVFDLDTTEIPHGFKPDVDLFKEKTLLENIMEHISTTTGMGLRDIAIRINTKQEQLFDLVEIEVAALLVAREMGCDIDLFYEQVHDAAVR
ncbi:MAG: DUF2240 family protein [Methanosarcinaceae archaeon]|nr:DUF2240 family protein [Methanosarcinaceae archaeon]MDF1533584.1 DUF2240 family protein [Methanosarcinaceae archaeon]